MNLTGIASCMAGGQDGLLPKCFLAQVDNKYQVSNYSSLFPLFLDAFPELETIYLCYYDCGAFFQ